MGRRDWAEVRFRRKGRGAYGILGAAAAAAAAALRK
jgi:hypothetical protein